MPFEKKVSGNPNGRPPKDVVQRALNARVTSWEKAIAKLTALIDNAETPPAVVATACKTLLEGSTQMLLTMAGTDEAGKHDAGTSRAALVTALERALASQRKVEPTPVAPGAEPH